MTDWIPLLVTDPSPNLQYLVLTELLDDKENKQEIIKLAELRITDALIKQIIEQQNDNGSWNPGILYNSDHRTVFQTTCDVLKRLGYLGFDSTFKSVSKGIEYIFNLQNDDGSWAITAKSIDGIPSSELQYMPLQTALPLRALVSCGYAEDRRSLKAFDWLLEKQLPDGAWATGKAGGGVNMYRAGYRKLPLSRFGCRSNTTGVLSCLAYHPKFKKSDEAKKGIEHLLSCQSFDRQCLGFEVARIVGFEGTSGTLTYYAKLDQLLTIDLSWRIGVSSEDKNLKKILDFVKNSINKFGLLLYEPNIIASKWITFDFIRSLKNLQVSDTWFSDNIEIPFQKYSSFKKRY